jgi:hypothetical protein
LNKPVPASAFWLIGRDQRRKQGPSPTGFSQGDATVSQWLARMLTKQKI